MSAITIGEALEATAKTAGDKPVDQSDAAAIQAAEVRATGSNVITPGGLAATAQSAASFNAGVDKDENKIKLRDVLTVRNVQIHAFIYIYVCVTNILQVMIFKALFVDTHFDHFTRSYFSKCLKYLFCQTFISFQHIQNYQFNYNKISFNYKYHSIIVKNHKILF